LIQFEGLEHKYTAYHDPNKKYTSWTSVLGQYHEHFEDTAEFWKKYKVIQYITKGLEGKINKFDQGLNDAIKAECFKWADKNTLFSMTDGKSKLSTAFKDKHFNNVEFSVIENHVIDKCIKFVTDHWDKGTKSACEEGTSFHAWKETLQEDDFLGQSYKLEEWEWDGTKFNFKPGYMYNEVRLASHEHGIAGSCDKLHMPKANTLIISDFKTNKEIRTKSFMNKTMFYPVDNFLDTEYSKYSLQLSGYAYMLEMLGFEIEHLQFEHYKRDGAGWFNMEPTIYPVKYHREEVIKLFDHFALTQSLKID
jgi:hypothetical protein